jgi:hypothetical protein
VRMCSAVQLESLFELLARVNACLYITAYEISIQLRINRLANLYFIGGISLCVCATVAVAVSRTSEGF